MLDAIFPIGTNWSWETFFLYLSVSACVVAFCKNGALLNKRFGITSFNYWYIFSFIILVLLACLRNLDVGTDTSKYVNFFLQSDSFSFDFSNFFSFRQKEPGFKLLMYFIRSFTDNYTILFFVVYSIVAFGYISYIKFFYDENSDYLFLILFIFFFVCNMSGMRSALGQSFLLLSYIFLAQKRFLGAVLLSVVAISFHYTMMFNLFVIAFVFLLNNNAIIQKKKFWITAMAVLIVLSNVGMYNLTSIFAETKYSYYSRDMSDLSLVGSLTFVLFGILSVFYMKTIIQKDEKIKTLFIIAWSFLLTYPMLVVTGAYRIPNYYAMPRLSIWSACFKQYQLNRGVNNKKENDFVRLIVFLLLMAYLLMRFSKSSLDGGFIYYLKWGL